MYHPASSMPSMLRAEHRGSQAPQFFQRPQRTSRLMIGLNEAFRNFPTSNSCTNQNPAVPDQLIGSRSLKPVGTQGISLFQESLYASDVRLWPVGKDRKSSLYHNQLKDLIFISVNELSKQCRTKIKLQK
jgi:hypothetical protein